MCEWIRQGKIYFTNVKWVCMSIVGIVITKKGASYIKSWHILNNVIKEIKMQLCFWLRRESANKVNPQHGTY
jgi:hypothetical protein